MICCVVDVVGDVIVLLMLLMLLLISIGVMML